MFLLLTKATCYQIHLIIYLINIYYIHLMYKICEEYKELVRSFAVQ